MRWSEILMVAATAPVVGPDGGPAVELISNGGFDNEDDWTLTQMFGTELPTISLGSLNSTADNEGNRQIATQSLAEPIPPGNYTVSLDTSGVVQVLILNLGELALDTEEFAGAAATHVMSVPPGEEGAMFRIHMDSTLTVDNVSMTAAS